MKTKRDPNYNPTPGGKKNPYPSGNDGRLHPGLKLPDYVRSPKKIVLHALWLLRWELATPRERMTKVAR